MWTDELDGLVENKSLDEIIEIRDRYDINSEEWDYLNMKKALLLEEMKPSTNENIIYIKEEKLEVIPEGFTSVTQLPWWKFEVSRRSLLEYNPLQRHPIPYIIVKHKRNYFFTLRGNGSGELRLIGQIGLIGGHVGEEDINRYSLSKTLINGLKREIKEEAGIEDGMVEDIKLKGLIKMMDGVNRDHLGIVYEIELLTDDIKSEEEDVLKGMWIHESKIKDYYNRLEPWAKMVYDNVIK